MRSVPGSFWDFPAPRSAAMMHGFCEVLASTNHSIRFSPMSSIFKAMEDEVKDHCLPLQKTPEYYQIPTPKTSGAQICVMGGVLSGVLWGAHSIQGNIGRQRDNETHQNRKGDENGSKARC